jgi:hypothetical protein
MTAYKRALARLRPAQQEAVIGRIEMDYSHEELALEKPTANAVHPTSTWRHASTQPRVACRSLHSIC